MIQTSGEAQRCFLGDDGFWRCNFVIKNGREIRSKNGKWLKFPALLTSIIRNKKIAQRIEKFIEQFSGKSLTPFSNQNIPKGCFDSYHNYIIIGVGILSHHVDNCK